MMENQTLDITLLHTIFESTSEGILVTDAQGNILKSNKSAALILGIKAKELLHKNLDEILIIPNKESITSLFSRLLEEEKTEIHRTRIKLLEVEIKFVALKNGNFLLLLRDVFLNKTNRKMLHLRNMALEAAGNGIIITDARLPDLPIIYCNDGFVKMTGYSKQEILNRNCRFLQANDRKQKGIGEIKEALENGKSCQVVLRNYKKDGTLFWNELNITPVHNEALELCYFIGVQNDVTLTKIEEQTKDRIRDILEMITTIRPIKEIEKELISVLHENIKEAIFIIRLFDDGQAAWHYIKNGHISKNEIEAMAGLVLTSGKDTEKEKKHTQKEVIVEDISKIEDNNELKKLAIKHGICGYWSFPIISSESEVMGNLIVFKKRPGKPQFIEKVILVDMIKLASIATEHHKNTTELQRSKNKLIEQGKKLEERVKERTKEVTYTVQKLVEVNLNLEDQIKETREAENKATQSQAMLSAIAQNLPKGAIVVFNDKFEIVYVEGEELKHINLVKEEVEGKAIDEIPFFSDHQILKFKENIQETLFGKQFSFEVGFEKKIYAVNSRPLYNANNVHTLALFVYNNVTHQKKVEREIRHALKREQELSDLKSRFVSMASHEFRTPLSAILSSAILISKQNKPGNEIKIEKYVERIRINVKNLVGILNDFLSLDKLEEGKVNANPQLFDLVQFSKTLIEEMKPNKKKGQNIVIDGAEQDLLVFIDPKLLSHVLINLLSNAIKYSGENKDIIYGIANNGSHIVIEIKDFGIGIPIKEQEYLFERFFRAANAVNIQGTGLGLHIVRQYVKLMGGTVSFNSEMGKETIFSVELPTNLVGNGNNTNN
ncbi:PAS domain S-box protein [Flavobacteriaceae bacterium KMM 6897]|nr:PAS domain S-box protein [Flavobacteriaceae bacterium KMM 6897]